MESMEGTYTFTSDGSADTVCGFYLISSPEQVIEIEFTDFNVDCQSGGLVAVSMRFCYLIKLVWKV